MARGKWKLVAPPDVVAAAAVRRPASCPPSAPEGTNPRPPDLAFPRAQLAMAAVTVARGKWKMVDPPEAVAAARAGRVPASPPVHAPRRQPAPPHVPRGPHLTTAIFLPSCTPPTFLLYRQTPVALRGYSYISLM